MPKSVCLCVGSIKYRHENMPSALRCEMFLKLSQSFLQWPRKLSQEKKGALWVVCVYVCMCAHTHTIVGSLPVFSFLTLLAQKAPWLRPAHLGERCISRFGGNLPELYWNHHFITKHLEDQAAPLKVVTGFLTEKKKKKKSGHRQAPCSYKTSKVSTEPLTL